MSIRLRLTVLYTAILGVTLLVFALSIYAVLQRNLTREVDKSLKGSADRMVRLLTLDRPPEPGRTGQRPPLARQLAGRNGILPGIASFSAPDTYVQIVDGSGAVVARSSNLSNADLTLPAPRGGIRNQGYVEADVAGQALRLFIEPIQLDPGAGGSAVSGYLEVARPLGEAEQTLAHLRVILGLGGAGVLILAGAAGWALATVALRPIARLTEVARQIGDAQDFSRRVPYHGPRDEVGRLAGTFNEMLSRLHAAYGRIQSALEAQRRFVADASHELRTPLTTIRGNVELLALEDQGESPERCEALQDIASEAERMSRLVSSLLVLARADAGQHIERSPVAVRPIVEEVYRQARRMAGEAHLELGDLPAAMVVGSADHLKQLLLILLDNACKYTPPGGLVRLSAALADGRLSLSVADAGPGISPQDQERIFDRFSRLDPSRHGQGTGLGLSIARWIASEHQGRLSVESAPGNGSTFTFDLPVLPALPAAAAAPPAVVSAQTGR